MEGGSIEMAHLIRMAFVPTELISPGFVCPITCELFQDPVILGTTGRTFERKAITDWLKVKKCNPFTNEPLANTTLSSNYSLLEAIQLLDRSTMVATTKRKQDDTLGEQQDQVERNSISKRSKI